MLGLVLLHRRQADKETKICETLIFKSSFCGAIRNTFYSWEGRRADA